MRKSNFSWISIAGPFVTLTLSFGWTDDFNSFKLLSLGLVAGLALSVILIKFSESLKVVLSPSFFVAAIFTSSLLLPIFFSNSPLVQQIYGVYGRNLGFLHYLFLTLIFIGTSFSAGKLVFRQVIISITCLGVFEAVYGLLQFTGLDPIPWQNPDKWVFGTFGNPNYLSSFLALSTITTLYLLISKKAFRAKLVFLAIAILQLTTILMSASTQGLILLVFGFFAFFVNKSFSYSKTLGSASIICGLFAAAIGVLGIFQHGPLERFIYQDSISYRGDYWRAGIKMFQSNWLHGVGLDSFGDFYRMYRDATAANRRGLSMVSNSAHNLFIDLSATGGIFVLLSYFLILGLVLLSIIRKFRDTSEITLEYKVLVILWLAFNLQTIISINVPSLAIWGWIFSGLIVSYDNNYELNSKNGRKQIGRNRNRQFLVNSACCIICISIVIPLVTRDIKFSQSLSKNEIPEISRSVLAFPRDADQISGIAKAYEKLGKSKESLELAKRAVFENTNSARAWQVIFNNHEANQFDKKKAELALKVLDPFYLANHD